MDRNNRTAWEGVIFILLSILFIIFVERCTRAEAHTGHDHIPKEAERYRRQLTREIRYYMGLREPVSRFGAQIHQESGFRADAKSKYASGLAQFTDATWRDMLRIYPKDLEAQSKPTDPWSALKAMVLYMKRLRDGLADFGDESHTAALIAYNGGLKNLRREAAHCGMMKPVALERTEPSDSNSLWSSREDRSADLAGFTDPWSAPCETNSQRHPLSVSRVFPSFFQLSGYLWPGCSNSGEHFSPQLWVSPPSFMHPRNNQFGFIGVGSSEEVVLISNSFRPMKTIMVALRHYSEVLWKKVSSISVDMMDKAFAGQSPLENTGTNESMDVGKFPVSQMKCRVAIKHDNSLRVVKESKAIQHSPLPDWKVSNQHNSTTITDKDRLGKCNPQRWFGHVELYCLRAKWACDESRNYPRKILGRWWPLYQKAGWG